jgi:hypothetical protein
MELSNLNKSVSEILSNNYVIPLYQRNYAWSIEEIQQLLQDIYKQFNKDEKSYYFIGSLVVLKRKNGQYEVIDGQQRLTTISLIAKQLNPELKTPMLQYDSRPEVEGFLSHYFQNGDIANSTNNHLISHFVEAVDHIQSANLNIKETSKHTLTTLRSKVSKRFKDYFFNQVQIVQVEIPTDTDVAHYFEIMNNRGEQLEQHEIVKAKLLDNIQDQKEESLLFSKIWDACSEMNKPIHRLFDKSDREALFGEDYDGFALGFDASVVNSKKSAKGDNRLSIEEILQGESIVTVANSNNESYIEELSESIVDFPNFLMQSLKLYYVEDEDIPLTSDELLNTFELYYDDIEPLEFAKNLLFYRTVFDRFIIKSTEDDDAEDYYKWILKKPQKYNYAKKNQDRLVYTNSFDEEQEAIIKCLSMLQVSFRNKKYKNWLYDILNWFETPKDLTISGKEFLDKLNELALGRFENNPELSGIRKKPFYAAGTGTPHFLFNFIDYLYWHQDRKKFNFEFRYRNSVEHHFPQSNLNESIEIKDNLGNLCLVSRGGNSKMNNEQPTGKAALNGKYYRTDLPPKQKIMYDITNNENEWSSIEINKHYNEVVSMLDKRNEILGL